MSPTLRDLTDTLGPVTPPSPEAQALALAATFRAARDAEERERFRSMLGLRGDL